jgi:hypothetical protein
VLVSVCILASAIPQANRIVYAQPSVVTPALPYFSTLSHKRHDFGKNLAFDFLYNFF